MSSPSYTYMHTHTYVSATEGQPVTALCKGVSWRHTSHMLGGSDLKVGDICICEVALIISLSSGYFFPWQLQKHSKIIVRKN